MVERKLRLFGEADLMDEFGSDQVGNGWFDPQHCEQIEAESGADHRCGAQRAFCPPSASPERSLDATSRGAPGTMYVCGQLDLCIQRGAAARSRGIAR